MDLEGGGLSRVQLQQPLQQPLRRLQEAEGSSQDVDMQGFTAVHPQPQTQNPKPKIATPGTLNPAT